MSDDLFGVAGYVHGSPIYKKVMGEVAEYFEHPAYITVIMLSSPKEREVSKERAALIEQVLGPVIAGQSCRRFGETLNFRCFLNDDFLESESTIHLFAHLLLAYLPQLQEKPRRRLLEHVVRDQDGNLGIAFNSKFVTNARVTSVASFLWERLNLLLDGKLDKLIPEEPPSPRKLAKLLRPPRFDKSPTEIRASTAP